MQSSSQPTTEPISLSVFFPTFNEEENIATSIQNALTVLTKELTGGTLAAFEVVVVDDGSTDHTRDIVRKMAMSEPRIRLVEHTANQGHGAAIETGLRSGAYEYVFFTDADLQFDITELSAFINATTEADVVIGYRLKRQDPFMRLVNSKVWNFLTRTCLGLRVKDTNCAFKLFKKSVIQDIAITSGGAMTTIELLYHLQKRGVKILELPVTHYCRVAGSPTGAKLSTVWRALSEFVRFWVGRT